MRIKLGVYPETGKPLYVNFNISNDNMITMDQGSFKEFYENSRKTIQQSILAGMKHAGADKVIDVDKDVSFVGNEIQIKNIPQAELRNVKIKHSNLSPFEIGELYGQSLFRINDPIPNERNMIYPRDENGNYKAFDRERLKEWVLNVKLPRDVTEFNFINSLSGRQRERAINNIVYKITDKIMKDHMFEKTMKEGGYIS